MDLVRRKNKRLRWFDENKKKRYTATFIGIEVIPLFVVELLVVMPPKPRHDDSIENEVTFHLFL